MVKRKSYNQKVAVYWSVIRNNPDISSKEIGKRYRGTPYGMRHHDRNQIVYNLKKLAEFTRRLENTDARQIIKKEIPKKIYKYAKQQTDYSRKKIKAKNPKARVTYGTMDELLQRFFKNAAEEQFVEFYEEE